jgi:hypothetical protein
MNDNHMHIGIAGTGGASRIMRENNIGVADFVQHTIEAEVMRTLAKKASRSSFCHTCILRKDPTNCKNCNRVVK